MSLRVDLIQASEQRSASPISKKFVLRLMMFTVPALIAAFALQLFLTTQRLSSKLASLDRQMESAGPRAEEARLISTALSANDAILNEFKTWQAARIDWHVQLIGLMRQTPANIQLLNLQLGHSLQIAEETSARIYALTIKGRAVGEQAEQGIKALERTLQSAAPFQGATTNVSIPFYRADSAPEAQKEDRVFEILSRYTPRVFK